MAHDLAGSTPGGFKDVGFGALPVLEATSGADARPVTCGTLPTRDPGCPASEPQFGEACDPAVVRTCEYEQTGAPPYGSDVNAGDGFAMVYSCDSSPPGATPMWGPAWGISHTSVLSRQCPAPTALTITLDTHDCSSRKTSTCDCIPWISPQDNLDQVLDECAILNDRFWVTFENGCPKFVTAEHTGSAVSDCAAVMSKLRIDCSSGIGCAYRYRPLDPIR